VTVTALTAAEGLFRVLISGPPPWAESGYGAAVCQAGEILSELRHQVAISAYAGVHEERRWRGMQILGTGGKPYGNGVIAGNYARWNADLLLFACDPWTVDPAQLAGLHVAAWMFIDCDRLSRMEHLWLERARAIAASVQPIAASQHARRLLADDGWDAPLVPMAVSPHFYADADAGRAWRRSLKVPADAFVVSKVGVNDSDDRKSFEVTLQAFALFAARHKGYLYLHTEAQAKGAPNLAVMAADLGLAGRVAFADQDKRACDLFGVAEMRGIYNGTSVLDAATKGEGFGVPVIEALACGTPVIGCRNSAVTEKIRPEFGWLVRGQKTWARHHNAWWVQPSVPELFRAYEKAQRSAASMRTAALLESVRWSLRASAAAWAKALHFSESSSSATRPESKSS